MGNFISKMGYFFKNEQIYFKNGLFYSKIFRYQGNTNYRAIKSKLKISKLLRFELSCQQLDIFLKENFINENW